MRTRTDAKFNNISRQKMTTSLKNNQRFHNDDGNSSHEILLKD